MDRPVGGFLVFGHGRGQAFQGIRTVGPEAGGVKIRPETGFQARFCQAQTLGEPGGEKHPDADGLPMGEVVFPQPGLVFQGMGKAMAEVQDAPLPVLEGIAADDIGLDGGGAKDQFPQIAAFPERADGLSVGGGIPDQEGFQQFRGPGAQLPFRQGLQHFRGQESKHWLDNDPQHILVVVQIDAGLPADGRIDLGKERRRKVGVADAALVDGRGKTGHIRRDAPADRQDEGLSRSARLHQLAANRKDRVHGLVLLRGLDGDCRPRRPGDLPRPWGHFAVIDQIQLPFPRDERKHIPDPFSRFNANFHVFEHGTKITEKFGS